MNIIDLEKLLKEFELLPKNLPRITFMEICRHSRSRFEEICSRVLAFYLQPTNEHGLQDLLLKSILEIVNSKDDSYYSESVNVETEAFIENASLDILVRGETFVLGIENKINAELYNPLHLYKKLIDQQHENRYRVILSVREIGKEYELDKIRQNEFTIIYYEDLFAVLKKNIGIYYSKANPKYITYLFDFIETIENMKRNTLINDPQSNFFFDNSSRIDQLIKEYNEYKDRVLNIQKSEIATLKDEIEDMTGVEWKTWKDWVLFYRFNNNGLEITVESSFTADKNNPMKHFGIYISTLTTKSWNYWGEDVIRKYPGLFLDTTIGNRAFLHMGVIEDNNTPLILSKLQECYTFLKELVESKNK